MTKLLGRLVLYGTLLGCCGLMVLVVSGHGRAWWYPLYRRVVGSPTEAALLEDIRRRKPALQAMPIVQSLTLIAYKAERELEVWSGGRRLMSVPVLAASGGPGPKTRAGDRQVPEGLYPIEALNPASAFYLSLRVGYPNADDRARSQRLGVTDLGGDIYIHGKDVSIGCLAVGDDRIEDLYALVARAGVAQTRIIIAPTRRVLEPGFTREGDLRELDARIAAAIRAAQVAP